jgi:hypothetical protein
MEKLIEALQIFLKYKNETYPTHCEHDVLMICGISQEEVSEEDTKKLEELKFFYSDEYDSFISYRYGSA